MDSVVFTQQMINAISLGSVYALIAIGYTMVYGVIRLINFAHADIVMVGAYMGFFTLTLFELSFVVASIFSIIIAGLLGFAIDKIAYKPLRNAPRISLLITAVGVSFFLESTFGVIFGNSPKSFPVPEFFMQTIIINEAVISYLSIVIPSITFSFLFILIYLLHYTNIGIAIRAVAFDIKTIALMGINPNNIISIVFVIGSTLAAVGGIAYALNYPSIEPLMGVTIGIKAFAAAVLGGIGSIGGAVLGAYILGITEVMIVAFFPELSGYKDAFAFLFLIVVLLVRPVGIMGDPRLERSRF